MIIQAWQSVITWYMTNMNYWTVMLLMAIESSFIPFPSEIVIPPAAYKAAQGDLNIYLVVLSATVGCIIGALFNYYLALTLGRTLIYKFANTRLMNMMMINQSSIEKSEEYFRKHGKSSTFIGRLLPAIRQLISIPAGLARMNMKDFLIYTTLGAMIWNIILALLGYFLYTQQELLNKYYKEISVVFLGLGVLFIVYLVYKGFKKNNK